MGSTRTRRAALGILAGTVAGLRVAPAKAADTLRVGKAVAQNFGYTPLDIGMAKGIFKRHDIEITILDFTGGAKIAQAMAAGSVDISLSAGPDMQFVAKGAPEIAVASITESPVFMGLCIGKDSPIHTIDDLKGKVVATNGIGTGLDIALRWVLSKHHLEAKTDYTDVEVNFPNMKSALAEHKVDLISAVLPFMYDPELVKIGRTLFEQGTETGPSELLMWAARAPYIQENRAALVDLMEDVLRMQRWYFDPANHVEAQQIAAKITHQPIESLNWVFTKGDFYRSPNGNPDLKTVADDLKMEKTLGFLKTDIDVPKYADLSIVDEASTRLGKLKEE